MVTLIINKEDMKKYKTKASKAKVLKAIMETWERARFDLVGDLKSFHIVV